MVGCNYSCSLHLFSCFNFVPATTYQKRLLQSFGPACCNHSCSLHLFSGFIVECSKSDFQNRILSICSLYYYIIIIIIIVFRAKI